MIGNDIVDLTEAKSTSNWQRPRFLDKLFTKNERRLIQNSGNSFQMVWRLWSMKEAAYKLYTQLNPSRFYNPKGFECSINNLRGNVKFNNFECVTVSKLTSKYIISEAQLNISNSEVISGIVELKDSRPKNQSEKTKSALLNKVLEIYNTSKQEIYFKKSEFGVPTVKCNSEEVNISISHHGNFGAFAFGYTSQLEKTPHKV